MKKETSQNQFYFQKANLLKKLIVNLKKEDEVLSYGDSNKAVEIEFKNEAILKDLEDLDRKALQWTDSAVPSAEEIMTSEWVFSLLDEARQIQKTVQAKLTKAMDEAKSEYLEVKVKRQLKTHLLQNSNLSWTKNYC